MVSLIPKAVALVRHGQAYDLIGSLLAAWGPVERADTPAAVLAALDRGADLLVAEQGPYGPLEAEAGPRLKALAEAGRLRVLLLTEPGGRAPATPVGAAVPLGAPLEQALSALQLLVLSQGFEAARRWSVPAELGLLTGPVRGTLLATCGTRATLGTRALVPAGTRGTLHAPAGAPALPCQAARVERVRDAFQVELELPLEGAYRLWAALRGAAPAVEVPVGPAPRLLVVDDSELLNRITTAVLTRAGFEVRCLTNPFELRRHALEFRPDLVLVDYNIPLLAGDKVIDLNRQVGVEVPMVLYSGAEEAQLAAAAARCGALGYLPKRLPPEALVSRLRGLLAAPGR